MLFRQSASTLDEDNHSDPLSLDPVTAADIKYKHRTSLTQIGLTIALGLSALVNLNLSYNNRTLANQQASRTFVQNPIDGTASIIEAKDANYRDSQLIQSFVNEWVSLTFSWNGTIPGTDTEDPGIQTEQKNRIPTNAWIASQMMHPELGNSFRNKLGEIVPKEVFSGDLTSAVYVTYLSQPRQTSLTTWEVDVVASRTFFDPVKNIQQNTIPFNRTITVEAVAIPKSPLGENANTLEQTLYKMRSRGLQITRLTEFNNRQ